MNNQNLSMHFNLCFLCCQINKGLLFFLFMLLKCKGVFLLLVNRTQDLGCPTGSATNEIYDNFLQRLHEIARTSIGCLFKTSAMEWLTDVADVKMLVEIRSLISDFIEDFLQFRNNAYVIILTHILLVFLHCGMLFSAHTLRKLTARKLAKFMKLKSACCFLY